MRKARGGGGGKASQTKNREAPQFFSIPTSTRSSLSFALASSSLVMNDQIKIRRENWGLWTVYYETDKSFRKIGPSENNPAVNGFWANSSLPLIFYITLLFPGRLSTAWDRNNSAEARANSFQSLYRLCLSIITARFSCLQYLKIKRSFQKL